jgi:hypothetical protein
MTLPRALLTALLLLLLAALADAAGVQLQWDYPPAPNNPAVGFSVYRQYDCAGPVVKLNPDPLPLVPTAYTDRAVQAGRTYCWFVVAQDGFGTKSDPSNTVQVRVPQPAAAANLRGTVVP